MTCRYSETNWLDVLYNSVRAAPGGVTAAAKYLTERRSRSMHTETLRSKLRGVDGDTPGGEILELLTEWMLELNRPDATAWVEAFCARWNMACAIVEAPPVGGHVNEVAAIKDKLLLLTTQGGVLTAEVLAAVADGSMSDREADRVEAVAMEEARTLFMIVRNARRMASQSDHRKVQRTAC